MGALGVAAPLRAGHTQSTADDRSGAHAASSLRLQIAGGGNHEAGTVHALPGEVRREPARSLDDVRVVRSEDHLPSESRVASGRLAGGLNRLRKMTMMA